MADPQGWNNHSDLPEQRVIVLKSSNRRWTGYAFKARLGTQEVLLLTSRVACNKITPGELVRDDDGNEWTVKYKLLNTPLRRGDKKHVQILVLGK